MAKLDRRWLLAALLGGAGVLGWLAALGASLGAAGWLALPEDAELTDLAGAAAETAANPPPGPGQDAAGAPDEVASAARPGADDLSAPARFDGGLSKEQWVDPILRRNIFDSSKVGQEAPEGGEVSGEGRRTDLKVVLLATVVAFPEIYSSALISEDGGSSQGYGVGDALLGEATIFRIEQKKVFIRRNDGSLEYIDMESGGSTASGAAEGGVASAGESSSTIERSLVEQALANPEELARQVRVTPHRGADGEVDGYRLSGVRRGSLLEKAGVKNGDIVHTVNGKPLTSTSAAMDAYQGLQSESSFTFEITRRSKRQTLNVEVR